MKEIGVIKLFKRGEGKGYGYGFITPNDGGKEIFFHISAFGEDIDQSTIENGTMVKYFKIKKPKGYIAVNIELA